MARPEEKAQNMMNKVRYNDIILCNLDKLMMWLTLTSRCLVVAVKQWVKMAEGDQGIGRRERKRPYLASLCDHLYDAEKFRRDIVKEISTGIQKIQNAGMGEHAIRDLNDHINKLFREKHQWNKRIIELGGPDYIKLETRQRIEEGDVHLEVDEDFMEDSVKGSGGYRYFGAAKDLPGVKELFMRHAAKVSKRKRGDVYKNVTPDYYGLRDEEDGRLIRIESQESERLRKKLRDEREQYKDNHLFIVDGSSASAENLLSWDHLSDCDEDENSGVEIGGVVGEADAIAAHFSVPTQHIVEQALLQKKKKDLLLKLGIV